MIYFIKASNGFVKIGYSNKQNLNNRLKSIQANSPLKLYVVKIIDGHYQLEKKIHKYFNFKRKHGEWFKLNNNDIDFIKCDDFIERISKINTIKKSVQLYLTTLKEENGYTNYQVGSIFGCDSTLISKLINGKRKCSKKLAKEIERVTGGLFKKEELVWP